jgi:hypothetical protein
LLADEQISQCTLEGTNPVHVHVDADHEHSNDVHDEAIAELGEALKWLDVGQHC